MTFKEAFQDWWKRSYNVVITIIVTSIFVIVGVILLFILIILVSCNSSGGPSRRDQLMYNNGTHNNCGGKWYFIEDSEDGTITYKCNKCGIAFTANGVVVIKGD